MTGNSDLDPDLRPVAAALTDTLSAYAAQAPDAAALRRVPAPLPAAAWKRTAPQVALAAAAVAVTVSAGLTLFNDDPASTRVAPATSTPTPAPGPVESLPTCGTIPKSASRTVAAVLETQPAADSGATIPVSIRLHSRTGRPQPLTTGHADILIVNDRAVVGRGTDMHAAIGYFVTVPASGGLLFTDQFPDREVTVAGCAEGPGAVNREATRRSLPPGDYRLIAVIDNGRSPIVSAPVPLHVTAVPATTPSQVKVTVLLRGAADGPKPKDEPASGQVELLRTDGSVAGRASLDSGGSAALSAPAGQYTVRYLSQPGCSAALTADPGREYVPLLVCTTN